MPSALTLTNGGAAATAFGGVDQVTLTFGGSGYTFPTVEFDLPDGPDGVPRPRKLTKAGRLANYAAFIPAITDGAVGYQLWSFWQDHREFRIDEFRDEADLAEIVFGAKRSGALIIGGGVSKHHTLWWNQFRDGLDFAVYITTAQEYDGSLSGARLREGVSWGKVKEAAMHVTIEGDATALLPLMLNAALAATRGG